MRPATVLQDIPAMLPQILKRVRLLWSLSAFYSSPERLTGLLRRVSNQLIAVCTAAVSVPDALCGDAGAVLAVLQVEVAWREDCSVTTHTIIA